MLELIPSHTSSSRIANDAINHFLAFSGRDLHDGMDYISYTPYGNSNKILPVFPGVYPPWTDYVKALLRVAMPRIENRCRVQDDVRVLVIGSGSGIEGVEIASQLDLPVDCVDINLLAVANTQASALYSGLEDRIRVWQSDGLASVDDQYDFILFNAPIPHKGRRVKDVDINLFDPQASTLRGVFGRLPRYLRDEGRLLLMSEVDIGPYLPSTLLAECVLPFQFHGLHYAIHEVRPA